MYSKMLIANRGEVAVRIIRACKEMGIKTVAVYSTADEEALHTNMADESYCIGGPLVKDSYLNIGAIITIAKETGVEAIHPGYGMLSENPEFAKICEENNIAFIGPDAEIMRQMGQKDAAREIARKAGVPITEGSGILSDVHDAMYAAQACGYPVMLKARAGGGGKGIRIVRSKEEMPHAYASVFEEAKASFGDGSMYLEKYLENVKHIEVQILADKEGNVVVLGDRDCSIQRKNQKLIEECPAPVLGQSTREKMYDAAVRLVRETGYTTVGTIEFLVTEDEQFYFMEMNTRLQVEHSVTEMVCQLDIVKWQIRTANGFTLPFQQKDIRSDKHAIECRICAEDSKTFQPVCGTIQFLHVPGGPNVRFDSAMYQECEVSPFYDSMLGKLIVCSGTREESIRKMKSSLSEFVLSGVENNRDMHMKLMENEEFEKGTYTTDLCRKLFDV